MNRFNDEPADERFSLRLELLVRRLLVCSRVGESVGKSIDGEIADSIDGDNESVDRTEDEPLDGMPDCE